MNLSVKGSLLPISERWPPPLPPLPPHTHTSQGVSRPRSGLVSLPTSLVSLSCWLFSHWILQYLQRQNKAWAIDPPHLPRRFSVCAAVTGPLPALLCLRLCCGLLPGAGVPWNYLPSASGRGWGLTAGFSLLVPLFLCPLWEERLVGGWAGGSVRTRSLLAREAVGSHNSTWVRSESFWVPRPSSDLLAPSFPEPLVLPPLYRVVFILCQKNHLKPGNGQQSWQNIFSATLGLTFYRL